MDIEKRHNLVRTLVKLYVGLGLFLIAWGMEIRFGRLIPLGNVEFIFYLLATFLGLIWFSDTIFFFFVSSKRRTLKIAFRIIMLGGVFGWMLLQLMLGASSMT